MNWSGQALKLTIGIGSLGVTAILSDVLAEWVGIYMMIAIILVPLTLLVMIKPGELAGRYVKAAHLVAGFWYALLVMVSVYVMWERGFVSSDLIMGAFMALGFAPVFMTLKELKTGGYDGGASKANGDDSGGFDDFEPPEV